MRRMLFAFEDVKLAYFAAKAEARVHPDQEIELELASGTKVLIFPE